MFIRGPPLLCLKNLQKHRYRARLLPSSMYKNSKNIERTLFSWLKIKTQKTQITSSVTTLYYQQKLQKYTTNSVFMVENLNAKFDEKRQNRPSEIRLSRVPPIMLIKTLKTQITSSVTILCYLQKLQKYRTNSVFMGKN